MPESADSLHLVLALTIDSSPLVTSNDSHCDASAVITFSCEIEGVRCDGEISLRLTLAD